MSRLSFVAVGVLVGFFALLQVLVINLIALMGVAVTRAHIITLGGATGWIA